MSYRNVSESDRRYLFDYNQTTTSPPKTMTYAQDNEMYFDYFILVLYFFTALLAMLGNAFVCYVLHKTPKFNSTTFTLLFNMAVSNFLSGLVILSQWGLCSYYVIETYSPRACVLNKSFQILLYYVDTYTMMLVAIDRYILIKYPHTKGLGINKYAACGLTWLVGFLFSLTTLMNMRINEYFGPKHLITCRIAYRMEGYISFVIRKYRIAVLIVSQFAIPLLVVLCLYSIIWRIISARDMVGNQADAMKRKQFSKNKKKLIKMLILVVIAFIIAWLPLHTIHFLNFYVIAILPKSCNSGVFYNMAYWMSISSCCFNVFIYYYGNPDFKREALIIYCKITGRKQETDFHTDATKEISNATTTASHV